MSEIRRTTDETDVRIVLGATAESTEPKLDIETGDSFLDHMLAVLGRYAVVDLRVRAVGDLVHHLVEDVAITLGLAFRDATTGACVRYATRTVPMDDALVEVALDIGGRHFYQGPLPDPLYDHFMRSLAVNGAWTLHVRVLRGTDRHHMVEAAFKALGLALRAARLEGDAVFSTKGAVSIERHRQA